MSDSLRMAKLDLRMLAQKCSARLPRPSFKVYLRKVGVIGGLVTSTLFILPVVYQWIETRRKN